MLGNPLLNKIAYKLRGMIRLRPRGGARGNALLYYMCEPFLYGDETLPLRHTNLWECRQMAKTLLEMGYRVDVVDWQNKSFIPKKKYDVVIDIHDSLPRLTPYLPSSCKKIFHITGSHWLFCVPAEYKRLAALKERRGVVLLPRRVVPPDFNAEYMDAGTVLGNSFTQDTFTYANKPLYHVPISTTATFPYPESKDFENAKKNFLWFGGSGMVHKGLDLVLEAFAKMPELSLTVVGPVHKEADFEKAYHKELYETPNIRTLGFLDVEGKELETVLKETTYLIYPSCSEGGGGSVVAMMHAGLIPIISYESSVTVENFGVILKESSVEEIERSVRTMSGLPASEVASRSKQAWEYARAHHSREVFAVALKAALLDILQNKKTHAAKN